ncbi:kxDL motif-containing protein CG10681 [Nilaparvata lugens]|uniref:kxDL motif-containing protein CG10681 n=1 Tax=Nilaparvata lugens TaxID=108931 RepID=UPI00193E82CC|nr:kxDL motif-containing protein CG10681 [Nilaparvata lugens]
MATETTPESDIGSIECFQNYTAPEVFIQGLAGIVDQQDVESMIRAQKQMLQRFEKTNEMLLNCNSLSVNRLKVASAELKKHTQLLVEIRKDLDGVFKRVRNLKTKLGDQYPDAFAATFGHTDWFLLCLVENGTTIDLLIFTGHYFLFTADGSGLQKEDINESPIKRMANSSSDDSENSNNDSSPYTSDTG